LKHIRVRGCHLEATTCRSKTRRNVTPNNITWQYNQNYFICRSRSRNCSLSRRVCYRDPEFKSRPRDWLFRLRFLVFFSSVVPGKFRDWTSPLSSPLSTSHLTTSYSINAPPALVNQAPSPLGKARFTKFSFSCWLWGSHNCMKRTVDCVVTPRGLERARHFGETYHTLGKKAATRRPEASSGCFSTLKMEDVILPNVWLFRTTRR
jgi:hypothetical protein